MSKYDPLRAVAVYGMCFLNDALKINEEDCDAIWESKISFDSNGLLVSGREEYGEYFFGTGAKGIDKFSEIIGEEVDRDWKRETAKLMRLWKVSPYEENLPASEIPENQEEEKEDLTERTRFTYGEAGRILVRSTDLQHGIVDFPYRGRYLLYSGSDMTLSEILEAGEGALIDYEIIKKVADQILNERGKQEVGNGLEALAEGEVSLSKNEVDSVNFRSALPSLLLAGATEIAILLQSPSLIEHPEMIVMGMGAGIGVSLGTYLPIKKYLTRRALNKKRKELPVSGVGGAG